MPGRLFLTRPLSELCALFDAALPDPETEPQRCNISPGQDILTVIQTDGIRRIARARWGMIPVGRVNARGRPALQTIVNARSETLFQKSVFSGTGRAIVPADGWYEWTGPARRKIPWRISARDRGLLAFAAITDVWTAPGGRELLQVATVTCAPNADVASLHDRMGVILEPEDWPVWLSGSEIAARALLRTPPEGRLIFDRADDVDFSGI